MIYVELIKKFGQVFVIFLLVLMLTISYARMKIADASRETCTFTLQTIKANELIQQGNIKKAEERVLDQQKKSSKETKRLASSHVPSDCEAAIKWGSKNGANL